MYLFFACPKYLDIFEFTHDPHIWWHNQEWHWPIWAVGKGECWDLWELHFEIWIWFNILILLNLHMIFIVIHGDQALKSGQERLQERECDASGQFHCLAWENFLRPPSQTFLQHRLKFKIRHHCSSGLNIQIQNMEFSKNLHHPARTASDLDSNSEKKGPTPIQTLYYRAFSEDYKRSVDKKLGRSV